MAITVTTHNLQHRSADRDARATNAFPARVASSAEGEAGAALPAPEMPGRLRRLAATRAAMALCAFAIFVGLWYGLSAWINNRILVPSPTQVASALVRLGATG